MFALAAAAAFMIIAAFLIGLYSMFRVSEHYNREFRRIIEEKTELRVMDEMFDIEPEPKRPVRPTPQRKQRPAPKTDGGDAQ